MTTKQFNQTNSSNETDLANSLANCWTVAQRHIPQLSNYYRRNWTAKYLQDLIEHNDIKVVLGEGGLVGASFTAINYEGSLYAVRLLGITSYELATLAKEKPDLVLRLSFRKSYNCDYGYVLIKLAIPTSILYSNRLHNDK